MKFQIPNMHNSKVNKQSNMPFQLFQCWGHNHYRDCFLFFDYVQDLFKLFVFHDRHGYLRSASKRVSKIDRCAVAHVLLYRLTTIYTVVLYRCACSSRASNILLAAVLFQDQAIPVPVHPD